MKIVIANKFYHPQGGADTHVLALRDLLLSGGHEVIPFAMDDPKNEKTPWSKYFVSAIDFGKKDRSLSEQWSIVKRTIYSREAKKKFGALLDTAKPDIVHIHNIYHQISPSILDAARERGVPVIGTIHDYNLICPNYKLFARGYIESDCKGGRYYREALYKTVQDSYPASILAATEHYFHDWSGIYRKGVRHWIAPSRFVKKKFTEYGMPSESMSVLYHFLSDTNTKPTYKPGAAYVYAGRLSEEKGIGGLLEAIALVPKAELSIVGDGPLRNELQRQVEKLDIGSRVSFKGHVDGDTLKEIIRTARAVIVPSVWYEIFGLAATEGWALGKAVIASRIGALEELGDRVSPELLFPPGDTKSLAKLLQKGLSDPGSLEAAGRKGREFTEQNCDSGIYIESLVQLYTKVIAKK